MKPPANSHETFVIERTYDASPAQVYRAWSERDRKARWFAGSDEGHDASYELDFRIGGGEFYRFEAPDGPVYTYKSSIYDIIAEQRIVYVYEMYAGDRRISVSVATIQIEGDDAKTRLVLTEQGVFLDGLDQVSFREAGTRTLLEQLADSLDDD